MRALISTICITFAAFLQAYAGIPVISELSVLGSDRGIALTIGADGRFEIDLKKINSLTVKATVKNVVYGLNSNSFDEFSSEDPIRKITAKQLNDYEVEFTFILNVQVEANPPVYWKGTQLLALLSKSAVSDFKWRSSKPENHSFSGQTAVSKKQVARLSNMQLIQRDGVSELLFIFDSEVTNSTKREGDSILIIFHGALNGLQKKDFTLPVMSVYKSVNIRDVTKDNENTLNVVVMLDGESSKQANNLTHMLGNTFYLYVPQKNENRIAFWTSDNGLVWDHQLIDVQGYQVDMKSIGERAKNDAEEQVSEDVAFSINGNGSSVSSGNQPIDARSEPSEKSENSSNGNPDFKTDLIEIAKPEVNITNDTSFISNNPNGRVIRYTPVGRDPFIPLSRDSIDETGKPRVDNLKLVGILYDRSDKIALLEDHNDQNKPYALRENDPVDHGKVLKISQDKVVFLLSEFGISRSFTLRLTRIQSEQGARSR